MFYLNPKKNSEITVFFFCYLEMIIITTKFHLVEAIRHLLLRHTFKKVHSMQSKKSWKKKKKLPLAKDAILFAYTYLWISAWKFTIHLPWQNYYLF